MLFKNFMKMWSNKEKNILFMSCSCLNMLPRQVFLCHFLSFTLFILSQPAPRLTILSFYKRVCFSGGLIAWSCALFAVTFITPQVRWFNMHSSNEQQIDKIWTPLFVCSFSALHTWIWKFTLSLYDSHSFGIIETSTKTTTTTKNYLFLIFHIRISTNASTFNKKMKRVQTATNVDNISNVSMEYGVYIFLYFWKLVGMRCDFCARTKWGKINYVRRIHKQMHNAPPTEIPETDAEMVKIMGKRANKSYKIVVIAHNRVKRVLINIVIVKDLRFDPIWRHFTDYYKNRIEKICANKNNNMQAVYAEQMLSHKWTNLSFQRRTNTHTHTKWYKQKTGKTHIFSAVCWNWNELMLCSGCLLILMN